MSETYDRKTIKNLQSVAEAKRRQIGKRSLEIGILEVEQEQEEEEVAAIDKIVERWEASQPGFPLSAKEPEPDYAGDYASLGLRDAIRQALGLNPKSLRAAEIREVIVDGGFVYRGKTDLTTRIGNDCWKMAKSGELINQKGRYRLAEGAT